MKRRIRGTILDRMTKKSDGKKMLNFLQKMIDTWSRKFMKI